MKYRILKWYSYRSADYFYALEQLTTFSFFGLFKVDSWVELERFGGYMKAKNWQEHYKCEIIEQED